MIAPNSTIRLLRSDLELDNSNQLTFSNLSAQTTYFLSKAHVEVEDATYQRKDNVIRFPALIDDIITYNYVMYKNESYSNKWFYAYIESMEYLNDNMTLIKIKTDVFQTWQFDIVYKKSFVEREHVNDDTIGNNTIPENLELGEYVCNDTTADANLTNLVYVIQVTEYINGTVPLATNYGGVYSAGGAYICTSITEVVNIIQALNQLGKGDAVTNVYVIPSSIIVKQEGSSQYDGQSSPVTWNVTISKPNNVNGYTPKNNKLFTSPYMYLTVDNNNGSSNNYQYELWSGSNVTFETSAVPTVGGSIKTVPTNYKGSSRFEQEGLFAGKFPTCGWINDTYTNWLTQNAVNIGIGAVSSGLQVIGGMALMSNPVTAVAGGSSVLNGMLGVASSMGQIYQHDILPNSARGNTNGGDLNTSNNKNTFYYLKMSIRSQYAKIIDDFFTMYGYKVNSLKIPNVTGRRNWNYVKTIGVNLEGAIPQDDVQELKSIFNNGVTFWHNGSNFLDYSQNNDII